MSEHLIPRITAKKPKKILTLDGGGIRGMMTIEVLAEIESQLLQQLKKGQESRRVHYCDFVEGTESGVTGSWLSTSKPGEA